MNRSGLLILALAFAILACGAVAIVAPMRSARPVQRATFETMGYHDTAD